MVSPLVVKSVLTNRTRSPTSSWARRSEPRPGQPEQAGSRSRPAGRKTLKREKRGGRPGVRDGDPRGEDSKKEKSETKVGSVGEEQREQIMQTGSTVTALAVSERVGGEEEREENRGGREARSKL